MDDVERQIRAWADAAAPADDGTAAVDASDVMSAGSEPRPSASHRLRWALAAAAVVVTLVLGASGLRTLLDDDGQQLFAGEPPSGTESVPGDPEPTEPTGDVAFEVLHVGLAGDEAIGTLRSASTTGQLGALWADLISLDGQAGPDAVGPVPVLDDRVVVSIVIADDACPPTLSGFRREALAPGRPDRLLPQFVEPVTGCDEPLIPKRYLVALDWASTGDRFSVALDDADPRSEISLDRARPGPVLVDVEVGATTVAGGGDLAGTVVVSNNSGDPIAIGYCGREFAVGLENDEADQQLSFLLCLQDGAIAPGTSRFEVNILTTFGSCTHAPNPATSRSVACLPEGGVPPLPPGEYRTRVYPPDGIDAVAPPVSVTVT